MSYDIRYGIESRYPDLSGDSMVVIGAPEYDNPTYNLRDMFVACNCPGCGRRLIRL